MATKIKYVQLEPAEVLLDFHTSRMTAEQFGCYWLIMMHLYCQGGKLNFDVKELSFLCNCTEKFEKVWEKIESKFQKKAGQIRHKRVSRELRRAKQFIRHQRSAGLASAKARQNRVNRGSTVGQPSKRNESEVKVSEDKGSEVSPASGVSGSVNPDFSSALTSITARSAPALGGPAERRGLGKGGLVSRQLRFSCPF